MIPGSSCARPACGANDDRQLVAVAAAIFRQGRVLCMRRAGNRDAGAGLWETLSGRVKPGEDPCAAISREIAEESGLLVRVSPLPADVYAARRGADPMVVLLYRAEWLDGEPRLSAEHDACAWWTPDQFARHCPLVRLIEGVRRAAALAPAGDTSTGGSV